MSKLSTRFTISTIKYQIGMANHYCQPFLVIKQATANSGKPDNDQKFAVGTYYTTVLQNVYIHAYIADQQK